MAEPWFGRAEMPQTGITRHPVIGRIIAGSVVARKKMLLCGSTMIVVVVVAAGLCHHHAAVAKGGEANHGSAPKASSFHAVSGTDRPAERLRVAILPPDCAVALPVPQMTTENIAAISTAAQAANHRWKVQACCFHLRMRARQAEEGGRRQLLRRHGELPPSLLPRLPWQQALPRHLPEHLGAVAAVARGDHRRVFYLLLF